MTAREAVGPLGFRASPLWTLQRLCFGPDVAADPSDRGENRDPGTATRRKKLLTKEARLENGPRMQGFSRRFRRYGQVQSYVRPFGAVHLTAGPDGVR